MNLYFTTLFLIIGTALSAKLPSNLKKCKQTDLECLKEAIQQGLPAVKNGIEQFGIAPIDPLFIPKMTIGSGMSVVQLTQEYENVTLNGLSTAKVTDLIFDLEKGIFNCEMKTEKLVMKGHYQATGKVLLLPVNGNGAFSVTLENNIGNVIFEFETITKKGEKYLKGKSAKQILKTSRARYNFENIFEQNQEIGNSVNTVLNENWQEIFNELVPFYNDAYGQLFIQIFNRFFSKIPVSELFSN